MTDKVLNEIGVVKQVQDWSTERDVTTAVFDGTQPNPTVSNLNDGLALLKSQVYDFVISLGVARHMIMPKVSLLLLQIAAP